jgi:hypothetical protein
MAKSLLETFGSLDSQIKQALAAENSPLILALAALEIALTEAGTQCLTAEHIVACLEAAGVAVKKTSVSRAMARAGTRVSAVQGATGEAEYKLMTKGRKEVEHLLGGGLMSVVRIEAGLPRTGRTTLGEMLAGLSGTARICDPYYGARTLDSLEHIPKACAVRFLTARTNESLPTLQRAIRDFIKERPTTEFRLAQKPHELHDRYVVTGDTLLILGHGLKDIGGKESFIIRLGRDLAPDLIDQLNNGFDSRWSVGRSIP